MHLFDSAYKTTPGYLIVLACSFHLDFFGTVISVLMDSVFLIYFHQIIVLENGKVVEQGPHEILLSKAGRYAQLWGQQNNAPDGSDVALKV